MLHYHEILPSNHRISNLVPHWETHIHFSVQAIFYFVGLELVTLWYARMTSPLAQCIPAVYNLTGLTVQSACGWLSDPSSEWLLNFGVLIGVGS